MTGPDRIVPESFSFCFLLKSAILTFLSLALHLLSKKLKRKKINNRAMLLSKMKPTVSSSQMFSFFIDYRLTTINFEFVINLMK